ncbi:hypothetical protein [Wenyingzhuangia aestuarii]|uniref:hypothetical protein n=1 Tax=Wenyingzhuangia aestuarii TaxID=1647582 RepID=UPI00143BCCD7|nr:hypothetical protein [Wenyingzhuangia aestuarii]NJB83631.1 hypothetical protein [Wenyingzhuangia aestuarii]
MKVKIGDTVYNAEETPIMLILTKQDKENIINMDAKDTKFVIFPDNSDKEEIIKWSKET